MPVIKGGAFLLSATLFLLAITTGTRRVALLLQRSVRD